VAAQECQCDGEVGELELEFCHSLEQVLQEVTVRVIHRHCLEWPGAIRRG
jgi:hypothetical protein